MKTAKIAIAAALFAIASAASASECLFGDGSFENGCEGSSAQATARMAALASQARVAKLSSDACSFGDGSFENGCASGASRMKELAAEARQAKETADKIQWGWIDGSV